MDAMLASWVVSVLILTVGLAVLARWMRRREDETFPAKSTLTDAEQAQARLGIAIGAGSSRR